MNRIIRKKMLVAGIALLALPSALLAQHMSGNQKDLKQVVITYSTSKNAKTIIEIDGDKVKVNGKDVGDNDDVKVRVTGISRNNSLAWREYNNDWNNYNYSQSFVMEDSNRAMLGVVTEAHEKGAEIQSITRESGADKAGLKKGDVITMVGDKKIENTDDVSKTVRAHKPGDKVTVAFLRDGKEQKVTAQLTRWKGVDMSAINLPRTLPGMNGMSPMPPGTFNQTNVYSFGNRSRIGLSVQETEENVGVEVVNVEDDGVAAKAGIQEGDIIMGIDDHEVKSTDDVVHAIASEKTKYTFTFHIKRAGKMQNLEVKMPRKLKTANL